MVVNENENEKKKKFFTSRFIYISVHMQSIQQKSTLRKMRSILKGCDPTYSHESKHCRNQQQE